MIIRRKLKKTFRELASLCFTLIGGSLFCYTDDDDDDMKQFIKLTFWLLQLLVEWRHSWIEMSASFLRHALATNRIATKRIQFVDLFLSEVRIIRLFITEIASN